MSAKNSKSTKVTISSYPDGFERLLELAEKRGYSAKALTALVLSAAAAETSLRRARRLRRAVLRHA